MACSWSWSWCAIAPAASRSHRGRRCTRRCGRLLEEGLAQGVSFAARGNLLLLAPPLVIGERELADALDLLDRLLGELADTLAGERSHGL